MTEEDLATLIAEKEERLTRQQARSEALERTMENTRNDIEQLKYILQELKRARVKGKKRVCIPRRNVPDFFARLSRFFDGLVHQLHHVIKYQWFCLVLCSRYTFEGRMRSGVRSMLAPSTVLEYFKRERAIR